ncbi:LptE family protein [Adhaeribacter terreus]|uniref:LptE family protein n=1 Tax=Adhaeribacter terreus TaxID=529703 RepID=A0ABW0EBK4_9BACT
MTLKNNKIALALFCFVSIAFFSGCVYSFSGTSLPPDVKTFSVATFPNNSGQGPSILSQSVTNNFRDFFQRNSNLDLVKRDGDLIFEGQIIGYEISPVAPQIQDGVDVAARNRLTLRLQVKFTNTKDPKQSFDQSFSAIRDFPQSLNINQIDETQIRQLMDQMMTEIFNRSVANW